MMFKIKRFLVIYFLVFVTGAVSNLHANQSKYSMDLKTNLPQLTELLTQDPAEFYRRAGLIKTEKIEDEDAAIDFYNLLSEYYYAEGQFDSMTWSLNQTKSFINDPQSPKLIPIYLQLGTSFYFSGKIDSVKYYQNIVSEFIDKKSSFYPQFLLMEGMKNELSSDYLLAIEAIIEAVKILESKNDRKKLAVAYNNLAINYWKINNKELHLEYLQKAVSLNLELSNTYHLVMNYNNLGVYYKGVDDLEKAVYYYELAFEKLRTLNSAFLLAQNFTNRANIHEKLGEYDLAEQLFLECEAICDENQILYGKMLATLNLGNLYRIQKKFDQSAVRLHQALSLTKTLKTRKEEGLTLQRLGWLAEDRQDYKTALEFQSRYFALNDSIIGEAVRKDANALREQYESEKKENEIISLSKQKLSQQYVIALMALGLMVLAIMLQWWRNKHRLVMKEKQKQELKKQYLKDVLEVKDREVIAQAAQLIQVKQQLDLAKTKISKILHEGPVAYTKANEIDAVLNKDSLAAVKHDFDLRLTANNEDFFKILLKNHPELSPSELKLCAYLRLNLPTKDLAEILNKSVRTIESSRTNIRKKLNLESQNNLVTHLLSFAV